MLGFIIGAACAIGLGRMLRRRGCHGPSRFSRFGEYRSDRDDDRGGFGRRHRFGSRSSSWALRALFERLETTPGQERAILSALGELRGNRKAIRGELKETRGDLARTIEGGFVEDASLEEAFARHDRLLAELRVGFVESLKKVAEALDESQRKQLAKWLESGFFRSAWGPHDPLWA